MSRSRRCLRLIFFDSYDGEHASANAVLAAMGIKKLSETVHAKQSAKTELKEVKVAH